MRIIFARSHARRRVRIYNDASRDRRQQERIAVMNEKLDAQEQKRCS